VYLTIESIFQQSVKADKVVLCIAKDDFAEEDLPALLKLQMRRGLEIEFCEKDLGPHTKYFYTLQKYPDDLVVTVDDDILYPVDMLDQLYRAYLKEPNYIHCHRAHRMIKTAEGSLEEYRKWPKGVQSGQASLDLFPTGVGGVLYFPGALDSDVFNQDKLLSLSPKADDVWLKAMSLKKNVYCKAIMDDRSWSERFLVINGSQVTCLKRFNKKGGNDKQIDKLLCAGYLSTVFYSNDCL
jgi:hypothetical protein